jgi:ATP-dependent Zn protease
MIPYSDEPPLTVETDQPPPPPVRRTRKHLVFWDRVKILVVLLLLWGLLFWGSLSNNPLLSVRDALTLQWKAKWWLEGLIALELLRQVHYLISEHWAGYHEFWVDRVFGRFERRSLRMRDWNRYRLARALRVALWLALIAIVVGAIYHEAPITALFTLPSKIWSRLPLLFQLLAGVIFVILEFGALFWFLSRGGTDVYFPDDIKTRFTDVWGQDAVLNRVKESMVFLEDPESIESRGGYVPGGVLLWGPPGTGKTLMAEAVAGETGKPFVFVDPGAFQNMFMGVGILKVKALFRKLRKLAVRYGGVIVFFDEADSLGNRGALTPGGIFGGGNGAGSGATESPFAPTPGCHGSSYLSQQSATLLLDQRLARSSGPESPPRVRDRIMPMAGGGGGMGTLQALLTELSGLKKPRGFANRVVRRALGFQPKPPPKYRIMVVMATNMPQALDEALLRPGRIDRIYKVGYPSKAGRVRTYQGYFDKVSHQLTPAEIEKLATITPYATGATIKDLVNESLIMAIRDKRDTITWQDVVRAKQLKDLGPPEDVEYIERERHAVAVHEACHAVVAYRVRHHLEIDIATIEKGGTYLGMVASIKPEDQFTSWRSEYEADLMVSLASLVGERLFFGGDSSSGVSGDLESATQIAILMEGYWGMGESITSHGVTQKVGIGGGGRPGTGEKGEKKDLLGGDLGERIENNLREVAARTEILLAANRREILAVAHALEKYKTLTGDDVEAVIEGRQGPLVDGRRYATPTFLEIAEAYHSRVVEAHLQHARVDVPLPVLDGWRWEPVAPGLNPGPEFIAPYEEDGNGAVGHDGPPMR